MSQIATSDITSGTGRRKNAVARVRAIPGSGKLMINGRTIEDFFGGLERHRRLAVKPLSVFTDSARYDYYIDVLGGGVTGQCGAISHGLARVIVTINPTLRTNLRKEGLLTRDPRMVERKKPGRPKARRRFQFSKR